MRPITPVVLFTTCIAIGVLTTPVLASEACPNEVIREAQHSTYLSDCRAYELVSPPGKEGAGVVADSSRTRAAADGSALGFSSLTPFGEPEGTSISTDFVSVRSASPEPGTNGWATHPITPPQGIAPTPVVVSPFEAKYVAAFTPDLSSGVFLGWSPLTSDPSISSVPNLYVRNDLRSPGAGHYETVTACPQCEAEGAALAAAEDPFGVSAQRPWVAAVSADGRRVLFESYERLTGDAPPQPPGCRPARSAFLCRARLYEWDADTVRLAGVLPGGAAADASFAGQKARAPHLTPAVLSDGSDGHSRVIFTQPANAEGQTVSQLPEGQQQPLDEAGSASGNLFMRVDQSTTVQLNVSERTEPDAFARATYLGASSNGERVFFMTTQALTDDAPVDGERKIYMYDLAKAAGDRLTLVTPDSEPSDGADGDAEGMIGVSADGQYAYLMVQGQLVKGVAAGHGELDVYSWHNGTLAYIAKPPNPLVVGVDSNNASFHKDEARVTPDARHMLFVNLDGGSCSGEFGSGCLELFLYSAETGSLACVSCRPGGGELTAGASDETLNDAGGSETVVRNNNPLSADGTRVFFNTSEALVPQDTNEVTDAYEYNALTGKVSLLSSGTDPEPSWFLEATPDGSNAFVVTSQPLVGWDRDEAYDVYDARSGGGFPEPPEAAGACASEAACHGALGGSPGPEGFASGQSGPGEPVPPPVVISPPKHTTVSPAAERARRLRAALRACRRRHRGRKRCEALARHRYGPHPHTNKEVAR
jgi:hypothetical protein